MGNCLPLLPAMCSSPKFNLWAMIASPLSSSSPFSISTCSSNVLLGDCNIIGDVAEVYEMGEEIGRGKFGVIRRCIRKSTGEVFACKTIAKAKLKKERDRERVRREVAVMQTVQGHPNMVKFEEALEDSAAVHLIMELCEGGDLFNCTTKNGCFREAEAACILNTLVTLIHYCHTKLGIMHRDLKPENILLASSATTTTTMKLADFGLAIPFTPGQKFRGVVGSPYYIAPEIMEGEYSHQIDIWSAGVILYILLNGHPPFSGHTHVHLLQLRKVRFHPLPHISCGAKDLIRGMLCPNACARLTTSQILSHPWIVKHTSPLTPLPFLPLPLDAHDNATSSPPLVGKEGVNINLIHTLKSNVWKDSPQEKEEEYITIKKYCTNSSKVSHKQEESGTSIKWGATLLLSSMEREVVESVVSSMVSNSCALHCLNSTSSTTTTLHHRHQCKHAQLVY